MKVLLLVSTRGLFGAENVILELSKQLPLYEFEPHIGILENYRGLHYALEEEAKKNSLLVKIFHCKGKFDIRTVFEIRKYVRQNQIILIHSQGYKSNFYSLLSGSNTKIKRIATCHNWLGNGIKMKFYENLDKLLLNNFDKLIAVSDILRDEIIRNRIPKEKVMVINNGVDIEKFRLQAVGDEPDATSYRLQVRKSLGIGEDEKVVGTVGRLSKEKGHIYLLEAVAKVISEFPAIKLLIVGDGPLKKALQATSSRLHLEDKVIFTGVRNDIPGILSIMDIFVLPSLKEGVPIALLEAMAAQKPIVATKVGAVPNLIEDKKMGLLIEPKDADAIANSIISLLKDEVMKKAIAINALEKVKNEFSSSIMAQRYSEVYKEILSNGRFN